MNNLRNIAENINSSEFFKGVIKFEEPLRNYTTFKVGGKARVFAEPENVETLQFLLAELSREKVPSFILGGGSNLVPQDEDLECFVISTKKLCNISCENEVIFAESGASIKSITDFCVENSLSGLENFGGLPGSVGGACYMNARCYETSFSDVLISAKYLDFEIDENSIADSVAISLVAEIQNIIRNEDYSDFDAIDEIVSLFNQYEIDCGFRHDF